MDVRHLGLSREELTALGYAVGASNETAAEDPADPVGFVPNGDGPKGPGARGWVWTVVVLCGLVWAASAGRRLPDPVAANAPSDSFSSARAMAQLVEIAERPHPPGSPEHERVRAWLVERLRALGLDTHVQIAVETFERDGTMHAATVRNIVARLPGKVSTGAVALQSRYDSDPLSPGAGQTGIGVAAILETVRALSAGESLTNDVVVVLTDASEHGLGARAFVERHPWASDIGLVLSVAMRGVSGPAIAYAVGPENGAIVRTMARALPRGASTSVASDAVSPRVDDAGLAAFVEAGVPGVGLAAIGGRAAYGQAIDRPIALSERTLQHHGAQLLAMARVFGTTDLRVSSELKAPDRVYASLPLIGLVHYGASRTLLVAVGLWSLWMLAALVLWIRRRSMRGLGVGLLLGAAGVAGASVVGWALFDFVRDVHPEYTVLDGPLYRPGIHLVALGCASMAWITALYAIARRRHGAAELFLGALVLPLAAAVLVAVRSPAAAMALHVPLAPAVFVALMLAATSGRDRTGAIARVASLVMAGAILFLVLPSLELMADALTLRAAASIAVCMTCCLLLMLPVLEELRKPRAWWAPTLAAASAAILMALGLPTVQGASRHPLPTALVYLVHDSVGQLVSSGDPPGYDAVAHDPAPVLASVALSRADAAGPGAGVERRMKGEWLVLPGVGDAWARSWVAEPRTETDPGFLMLPGQGIGEGFAVAGSGPATTISGPTVRVVAIIPGRQWRTVRLEVRSTIGAEMIGIQVPDGMDGVLTGVGGGPAGDQSVRGPASWRRLTHWGVPEGGALLVDLRLDANQPEATLNVLEHHLRPQEILGEYFFGRADSLIPVASVGSDRVIQRTPVRIFVAGSAS